MGALAREVLAIAKAGLVRRAMPGTMDVDESAFLHPLFAIAESGLTPAQGLLKAYEAEWQNSVDGIFRDCAY